MTRLTGFKGLHKGEVSGALHAVVLVHDDAATGKAVWNVAIQIKQKAAELFHIRLLPKKDTVTDQYLS